MVSIMQVSDVAEPPLIRQPVPVSKGTKGLIRTGNQNRSNGERLIAAVREWMDDTAEQGRRWLWIRKKLYGPSFTNGARIALAGVIVITLNPAAETQAAVAASKPETIEINLTANPATVQADIEATLKEEGVSPKPFVVTTEIGIPEREQQEREAKAKAQAAAAARAKNARIAAANRASTTTSSTTSRQTVSSAGNSYAYGYCTWWVKAKRPDLPNQLGNAGAWLSGAKNSGLNTGSAPQVGAAVITREGPIGHVAYVEAVNGDEITISEMNYSGWNKTDTRTIKANDGIVRGYIY